MPAGKSILELIWDELNTRVAEAMEAKEDEAIRRECLGLATAIAIIQNPYDPDIDGVRSQAMENWRNGNGESGKVRRSRN